MKASCSDSAGQQQSSKKSLFTHKKAPLRLHWLSSQVAREMLGPAPSMHLCKAAGFRRVLRNQQLKRHFNLSDLLARVPSPYRQIAATSIFLGLSHDSAFLIGLRSVDTNEEKFLDFWNVTPMLRLLCSVPLGGVTCYDPLVEVFQRRQCDLFAVLCRPTHGSSLRQPNSMAGEFNNIMSGPQDTVENVSYAARLLLILPLESIFWRVGSSAFVSLEAELSLMASIREKEKPFKRNFILPIPSDDRLAVLVNTGTSLFQLEIAVYTANSEDLQSGFRQISDKANREFPHGSSAKSQRQTHHFELTSSDEAATPTKVPCKNACLGELAARVVACLHAARHDHRLVVDVHESSLDYETLLCQLAEQKCRDSTQRFVGLCDYEADLVEYDDESASLVLSGLVELAHETDARPKFAAVALEVIWYLKSGDIYFDGSRWDMRPIQSVGFGYPRKWYCFEPVQFRGSQMFSHLGAESQVLSNQPFHDGRSLLRLSPYYGGVSIVKSMASIFQARNRENDF